MKIIQITQTIKQVNWTPKLCLILVIFLLTWCQADFIKLNDMAKCTAIIIWALW